MSYLNCLYPDSLLFATRQEELTFIAATPEYLLSCKDSLITSDAVADGTPALARPDAERFDEVFEEVREMARQLLVATWVTR